MESHLLQLYPLPGKKVPLRGLYLSHRINKLGATGNPIVYANFLSSLDGRIALEDSNGEIPYVPKSLTNPNDFRLFLELAAQADCMITHGGYLRALAERRLGNVLQIGTSPETNDLAEWRKKEGLSPQPDIIVASRSLRFTMPQSLKTYNQKCYIATGKTAESKRINNWKRKGYPVFSAGSGDLVEGKPLIEKLKIFGYKSIYLIAGPQMLATMVKDGQLNRLYHTNSHQLLGGRAFHTLISGDELGINERLKLTSLLYDPDSSNHAGQCFAQFQI